MLEAGSPLIQCSTNYAVNILYVLSFLTMGDGGMEASKLLGLLGLPNSTTMEKRSFGTIENRIGPVLQELCQDVLAENLDRAVLCSFNNDQAKCDDWKQNRLPQDEFPTVRVGGRDLDVVIKISLLMKYECYLLLCYWMPWIFLESSVLLTQCCRFRCSSRCHSMEFYGDAHMFCVAFQQCHPQMIWLGRNV